MQKTRVLMRYWTPGLLRKSHQLRKGRGEYFVGLNSVLRKSTPSWEVIRTFSTHENEGTEKLRSNWDKIKPWGYSKHDGPGTWYKSFPAGEGRHQSPINIVTSDVQHDSELALKPFEVNYGECKHFQVLNNGKSLQVNTDKQSDISGGPLKGTYRLEQFHFHWGSTNNKGSEHTIDGKVFCSEWHFVHWNTKYKNFTEALCHADGLAVLAYMVNIGKEHLEFKKVTDCCSKVRHAISQVTEDIPLNLRNLLKDDLSRYWTYHGSLTTPPLLESVIWIIFCDPVEISQDQMDALRSLQFQHGGCLVDNFRSPMPLNNRLVSCSF